MRVIPAVGMLCAFVVSSLAAQEKVPKRPQLPAGEDTCDTQAYYRHGVAQLESNAARAADAFYWSSRLDPTWPDALYARRIALLAVDPFLLGQYYERNERVIRSAKVQKIDSLQYRALQMNPFLYRRLEQRLFLLYLRFVLERSMRAEGNTEPLTLARVEFLMSGYMIHAEPEERAWEAYGRGDFSHAAEYYAAALKNKRNRESSWFHAERGRVFFMLGQMDSARVSLQQALTRLREKDEKKLVYVYESKALYEHAVGLTYELQGRSAEAREAYGRALQEDLSYHAAHVRTGVLALAAGDTAAAIAAMELAVQAGADDASVLYRYGELLLAARRPVDAEARLRQAIALDPYFGQSYYLLARALEAQGKRAEAAAQYRAYLERTWRADPNRRAAEAALGNLASAGAGT